LVNQFNKKEKKFFNNLLNYGIEITYEIYINTLYYNNLKPKISVVILFHNSDIKMKECLNSLIKQTFKNFEIICINENLNNDTLNILKEYKKKDKRIHILEQNEKNLKKSRNYAIRESKGEYLIFLDSKDVFDNSMIEELYTNIKTNNVEIVICNSNDIEIENGKKKIIREKNLNFDIKLKKNIFSIFDIKKDSFNFFFLWPFDKIFKKEFIERLKNKIPYYLYFDDLNFVASIVLETNKISFLDKILINHRIEKNLTVSNLNLTYSEKFYNSLQNLKIFLYKKNLYKKFKQDFINFVASYSIYQLENINGKFFCFLYQKLKNEFWNEFEITKYNKNYFYDKKIYKKIKNILESELEILEIVKQVKSNDKKINYLREKKISCFQKIFDTIQVYKTEKNIFNHFKEMIKKIIFIYFFIINFMIINKIIFKKYN